MEAAQVTHDCELEMRQEPTAALERLRGTSGRRRTDGLGADEVAAFLRRDPRLGEAIAAAAAAAARLDREEPGLRAGAEDALCGAARGGMLSFYGEEASSPYVPLAAAGPWIVTTHGAVLHDSGGYGMLGLGHAPPGIAAALAAPWVMANVMTPSLSQRRLTERLQRRIGLSGGCPYPRFICLNSGSEAVTLASRICDLNAFAATAAGARHGGREIRLLALSGSFHGRTQCAARLSHSTAAIYKRTLASFRDRDPLTVVPANDVGALAAAFAAAEASGVFFQAVFLEPVLGEGVPGLAITREFYDAARRHADAHGTLLVVDSIQAGLRAHGCLSIVDYPGFAGCAPPDMETFSKALNAGQYPLSVLALGARAAGLYVEGVYGNTMTANPRGLEVAAAVLDAMTDELAANVRARGVELKAKLAALCDDSRLGGAVRGVEGTGLMVCAQIDPRLPVCGSGGLEERLRRRGIAMIHGGANGLRFTPPFAITSAEIDLIVGAVRETIAAAVGAAGSGP
jgi:acetylornithine/succinyldiaminopimelate/putrescine aminotransferase